MWTHVCLSGGRWFTFNKNNTCYLTSIAGHYSSTLLHGSRVVKIIAPIRSMSHDISNCGQRTQLHFNKATRVMREVQITFILRDCKGSFVTPHGALRVKGVVKKAMWIDIWWIGVQRWLMSRYGVGWLVLDHPGLRVILYFTRHNTFPSVPWTPTSNPPFSVYLAPNKSIFLLFVEFLTMGCSVMGRYGPGL